MIDAFGVWYPSQDDVSAACLDAVYDTLLPKLRERAAVMRRIHADAVRLDLVLRRGGLPGDYWMRVERGKRRCRR